MINLNSEIRPLKKVLLHRPGEEIINLTPEYLGRLLFDDIPYLEVAQEEHDAFAKTLRDCGVEVVYLDKLSAEAIKDPKIKEEFLKQFINEAGITDKEIYEYVYNFLDSIKDNETLIRKTMAGINKKEIKELANRKTLAELSGDDYPFLADPMPNLYFTRDPFASIGDGISLNRMYSVTRNRETIYADYIFKYHPDYKDTPRLYNRDLPYHIEGGDILNLNKNTLAIGISQRTQAQAIELLAKNIFYKHNHENLNTILAFNIPRSRAFMHLDTVFTQIDVDKFTIHPEIEGPLQVFEITKSDKKGELKIIESNAKLEDTLAKYLGISKVTLLPCGGGDKVAAAREQWNDGSNTLCIKPGEVVVYSRNTVTNKLLQDNGIKTHIIPSSELSRGRGGPRCMSMPLIREK